MVYLVDNGLMRFAVDAGIRDPEAQQLIRDLTLPIGVGIFGTFTGYLANLFLAPRKGDKVQAEAPPAA